MRKAMPAYVSSRCRSAIPGFQPSLSPVVSVPQDYRSACKSWRMTFRNGYCSGSQLPLNRPPIFTSSIPRSTAMNGSVVLQLCTERFHTSNLARQPQSPDFLRLGVCQGQRSRWYLLYVSIKTNAYEIFTTWAHRGTTARTVNVHDERPIFVP
jgi:hypothetical protein